ncbi:MAG TPA: AraC family transcriptional regulator ligand-binding domain-containing protein [Nevskiales bacterium]|nr:AraC family transcriptional regulator ligand-binding domain-containing protein [Nevskiales bacterium]
MLIAKLVTASGIPAQTLFDTIGMTRAGLFSHARIPQRSITALWRAAEQLTGRRDIGLDVLDHFHIAALGPLAYELLAAATFREAANDFLRHATLISETWQFTLCERKGRARIVIATRDSQAEVSHHSYDAIIAAALRFTRDWLSGGNVTFDEIWFRHPDFGLATRYRERLGCRCRFGATEYALCFDAALLDTPMPAADHEVHGALDQRLQRQMERLDPFSARVERALREILRAGAKPRRAIVATRLGLGERTMLRRLSAESETFSKLSRRVREQLARESLAAGATLAQTAEQLGYADAASLNKALKRWTGGGARSLRHHKDH